MIKIFDRDEAVRRTLDRGNGVTRKPSRGIRPKGVGCDGKWETMAMAGFRKTHIVLAEGEQFSKPNILGRLGATTASLDVAERLNQVELALDAELTQAVAGRCVFRLLTSDNIGQVIVAAIEEPHFDHYSANIKELFSQARIEEAVDLAIANAAD